jgi:hypothetical protein
MTVDEVIACSYQALALIDLCEFVMRNVAAGPVETPPKDQHVADSVGKSLALASDLLAPVQDLIQVNALLKGVR